jgi:CPA1 family monovalent cation:H+ antiporter
MITTLTGEDLAGLDLFQGLGSHALEEIAATMVSSIVRPGFTLAKEGEQGFGFAVVLAGHADIVRSGSKIAEVGPGDIFGEMALESGSVRNADVVATSQMSIGSMMVWDYRAMLDTHREVRERIDQIVADRSG